MRTMRSISSVVTPGLMAACALSRMVLAIWQACLAPSICLAVLMGTAPTHNGHRRHFQPCCCQSCSQADQDTKFNVPIVWHFKHVKNQPTQA